MCLKPLPFHQIRRRRTASQSASVHVHAPLEAVFHWQPPQQCYLLVSIPKTCPSSSVAFSCTSAGHPCTRSHLAQTRIGTRHGQAAARVHEQHTTSRFTNNMMKVKTDNDSHPDNVIPYYNKQAVARLRERRAKRVFEQRGEREDPRDHDAHDVEAEQGAVVAAADSQPRRRDGGLAARRGRQLVDRAHAHAPAPPMRLSKQKWGNKQTPPLLQAAPAWHHIWHHMQTCHGHAEAHVTRHRHQGDR